MICRSPNFLSQTARNNQYSLWILEMDEHMSHPRNINYFLSEMKMKFRIVCRLISYYFVYIMSMGVTELFTATELIKI
jgi:hypothetical protein